MFSLPSDDQEGFNTNEACISILCFSSSSLYVRLSEQGMQIHISQTTKDHLEHEPYIIEERGKIFVKVRG